MKDPTNEMKLKTKQKIMNILTTNISPVFTAETEAESEVEAKTEIEAKAKGYGDIKRQPRTDGYRTETTGPETE